MTDDLPYRDKVDLFKKLVAEDKLSHAYLFFGGNEADRAAKFEFAKALVNFLENKVFELPVKPLLELMEIVKDEDGGVGIESAREMKRFLYQKPIACQYRVAVIRDAESMTPQAQNAILKVVEEPPESGLIIFIARNEDSFLPTIASRLQKIYFPPTKFRHNRLNAFHSEMLSNEEVDEFFESLILNLMAEPLKNFDKLKEILKRLRFIKQFNTNKRLQIKALKAKL